LSGSDRGDGSGFNESLKVFDLDAYYAADSNDGDFAAVNPTAERGEGYMGALGALAKGKKRRHRPVLRYTSAATRRHQ
jgi:hypothetical protein